MDAALESFNQLHAALLARGGEHATADRAAAWAHFTRTGLPPARSEAWKYTPPARLFAGPFPPAPPVFALDALDLPPRLPGSARVVLVNGRALRALCDLDPERVRIEASVPPAERLRPAEDALVALNHALFEEAIRLEIPAQTDGGLIELIHLMRPGVDPASAHPRISIALAAGAKLQVVETFVGEGTALVNAVTEAELGEGARLQHCIVQQEARSTLHLGALRVRQGAHSRLESHLLQLGAATSRQELHIRLAGEGASVRLEGLFIPADGQHHDNDVRIEHEQPGCESRQRFRGILSGKSRGVFTGRVHVHPQAQKTDADQSARFLLLSRDAEADLRPHLEIHADDVKATHGATIGELDPEQIFYLRSRGIPEPEARALLTVAFAREVLEALPLPELRARAEAWLTERMAR